MAITWAAQGFLAVIIVVMLFTAPNYFVLPLEEAQQQAHYAVILTGWLWLLAAPLVAGLLYLLRRTRQEIR